MHMKPQCTECNCECLLLLHLEWALVSLMRDTETTSCVINWGMSEPWRAGVMPAFTCVTMRDVLRNFPKRSTGRAMMKP